MDSLYCLTCGAANPAENTFCFVCLRALHNETSEIENPTLLRERYRILTQVGVGGFGAVYKAADTWDVEQMTKIVAIKQIHLHGLDPREAIEVTDAFNREVVLLSSLSHRSIPHIHEYFTDPEHWYLVMDFLEGETLEQYLAQRVSRSLPLDDVLDIALQLCNVLDYLHTRQPAVIFRDLKPANIMRTPTGQCFLIDFGIARHFKPDKLKDTMPLGSPGYAAPEQYGKAQTTPRADLYSLGAVLHQLLSGDDPSETPFRFAPLHHSDSGGIAELEALIMRLVETDAYKRPAHIGVVKDELQHIITLHKDAEQRIWRPTPRQAPSPLTTGYRSTPSWTVTTPGGHGQDQQQFMDNPSRRPTRRMFIIRGLAIGGAVALGLEGVATFFHRFESPSAPIPAPPSLTQANLPSTSNPSPPSIRNMSHSLVSLYSGHTRSALSVSCSPNRTLLASSSADKTVQLWTPFPGSRANDLYTYRGHIDTVTAVMWSPNGKRIASGSADTTVQVWDSTDGSHAYTYQGHSQRVLSVAWSPDGKYIVSGSQDGTVQVWDATSGSLLYTYYQGNAQAVKAVAWSPDGKRIALASNNVQVLNAVNGTQLYTCAGNGQMKDVKWSPDGRYLASADADRWLQIWDAVSGTLLSSYFDPDGRTMEAISWSPNSKYIVEGSDDASKWVLDRAQGGFTVGYPDTFPFTWTLAWSPDGKYIATGCEDTKAQVMLAP